MCTLLRVSRWRNARFNVARRRTSSATVCLHRHRSDGDWQGGNVGNIGRIANESDLLRWVLKGVEGFQLPVSGRTALVGATFVKHPPSDIPCGAANDCNQRAHPAVLTPFIRWLKGRAVVGLPCLCLDGGLGVLQLHLVLCKGSNHWQMTQGRRSGPRQKHRKVWAILGKRQLRCTHIRIVLRGPVPGWPH